MATVVATVVAAVVAATVATIVAAVVAATVAAAVAQNPYSYSLNLWIREWTPVHFAIGYHRMVNTTIGRKYNYEVLANLLGYNLK